MQIGNSDSCELWMSKEHCEFKEANLLSHQIVAANCQPLYSGGEHIISFRRRAILFFLLIKVQNVFTFYLKLIYFFPKILVKQRDLKLIELIIQVEKETFQSFRH